MIRTTEPGQFSAVDFAFQCGIQKLISCKNRITTSSGSFNTTPRSQTSSIGGTHEKTEL